MTDPFLTVKKLAFRLEVLPHYADNSSGDSADLEYFKATGSVPEKHNETWIKLIEAARRRGATVLRLRAVSDPLSPYENFELRQGYNAGLRAGEQIHIIERSILSRPFDYWCFDGELIEVIKYGDYGEHLGSDIRRTTLEDKIMLRQHLDIFYQAKSPAEYLTTL